MTSTRLPGKVLRQVRGKSLLERVIERLNLVMSPHRTVVATTQNKSDDPIARLAETLGVGVHRGSEEDVLSRYAEAAVRFGDGAIARVTSDCPLLDPTVVEAVFDRFLAADPPVDYASNTLTRTYPRGLDVEIFTREALATASREARAAMEREHVTPFIYLRPERFSLMNIANSSDESDHRWTVDTIEDLRFVQAVVAELEPRNPTFDMGDVLDLLARRPDIRQLNHAVRQKSLG